MANQNEITSEINLTDIVVANLREALTNTSANRQINRDRISANEKPFLFVGDVDYLTSEDRALEKTQTGIYVSPSSQDVLDAQGIATAGTQRVMFSILLFIVYSTGNDDDFDPAQLEVLLKRIKKCMYEMNISSEMIFSDPNDLNSRRVQNPYFYDTSATGFTYSGGEMTTAENGNFVWQDTWTTSVLEEWRSNQ